MLRVDVEGADGDDRAHQLTGRLLADLRATGLVTVERVQGSAPDRARSGTGTSIGELVLSGTLTASTVTTIGGVIIAWIKRTGARSVKWTHGKDTVEITGLSGDAQRDLVERLLDGTK